MKREGYEGEFLSREDILRTHDIILENSEVADETGFIDETGALFESAHNAIFASFFGIDFYPTIIEKASRLCFGIISNHCFRNANKRTAYQCLRQTLDLNGYNSTFPTDDMFDILTEIGDNKAAQTSDEREESYLKLVNFVRQHNRDKLTPNEKQSLDEYDSQATKSSGSAK